MTPTGSNKEMIAKRRARVSFWRIRGLSMHKIAKKLEEEGVLRKDGKPFTYGTVNKDLQWLSAQWQQEAAKTTAAHKARQIAELRGALEVAWSRIVITDEGSIYKAEDIREIRQINDSLTKLLGTAAPTQTQLGGMDDNPLVIKGYTNVSPDDWPSE